jgi:RNA polymerase sigma-54 factor
MTFVQRQELRQSQTLVMTPQLQQAIKLLQLNSAELMEYIESELEKNPLLEAEANEHDDPITERDDAPNLHEGSLESAYDNAAQSEGLGHISGGGGGFDGEGFGIEDRASPSLTLREHLEQQMNIDMPEAADRMIGAALIDMVDDAGYLPADLHDVAEILGCTMVEIENVLAVMQRFDPAGVMARSLKECLAAQLREQDRLDPAMAALLDNLHMIPERNLKRLAELCGVSVADVVDMVTEIKSLNPKPGLAFDHAPDGHVIPDVQMRPNGAGGWAVELNPDALPRLLVNRQYQAQVSGTTRAADREYLSEQLQAANWLVKALDQRAQTILKVSAEIVRRQSAFFVHGVTRLRPLVLREIAETIGMHESTISRVTSNKYILTPRGTFELKYFFSSSISGTFGDSTYSGEAIRARIKSLVDREDPRDVLSDDTLVEKLREAGIDIARRTVAKYREQLNIASSVQRRREKSMA